MKRAVLKKGTKIFRIYEEGTKELVLENDVVVEPIASKLGFWYFRLGQTTCKMKLE